MAYQAAAGIDVDRIRKDNEFAPKPDIVLIFDLPVDLAMKRQTGARALRSIIEDIMVDVMYEIPTKKYIKTCTITKDTVENKTPPKLTYYKKTA